MDSKWYFIHVTSLIFRTGDDLEIHTWDVEGKHKEKILTLEQAPIDFDWFKSGKDQLLAIACSDGSFVLATGAKRIDSKVPEAHEGAVISIKWSYDGAALATAGEDGLIKLWSKSGVYRSTLVNSSKAIYGIVWSPDNNILYCSDKNLYIQPTTPGKKATHWKAHDGIVLCCDWSPANNLIISGGEDLKYRVWDSYGRQLYCSAAYDHVITSIKWNPSGEIFAVGSFEMIRICDKSGWSHSFNKHEGGSLMKLSWNRDGTVVGGAGGNGSVLFGYIVDRSLNCGNIEISLDETNKINVVDCLHEMNDELDFKDWVVQMSLKHGHLIVATTT